MSFFALYLSVLNYNVFNLIIISGIMYGFIFTARILLNKKELRRDTLYLGLVVFFMSMSNLQYWLLDTGITEEHQILQYTYIPWHWLVLPMFYNYVFSFLGKKNNGFSFKLKNYLLYPFFLVATIHFTNVAYKLFYDNSYNLPSHFQPGIYVYLEFVSVVFNLIVMVITYKLILDYENDKSYNKKWVKSETIWLKQLINIGFAVCAFWFTGILLVTLNFINLSYVFYPMWLMMSFLIYWIGHVGIQKSLSLKQRIKLRREILKSQLNQSERNSAVNDSKTKVAQKIKQLIENERLYLNPNINISLIADKLNLSTGYISQSLNQADIKNFNNYINSLRINMAKRMLTDNSFDNYTVVSIGLEAGFNSKSSFYDSFKKNTGKTPTEYRKSVQNN